MHTIQLIKSNRISLLIIAVLTIFSSLSFQWPVINAKVTSTFGESRWDHFHDGVDVVSPVMKIHPLAKGATVYFWDKSLFPLDNYPGGGNYKVLRHGKKYFGIYMHLEDSMSVKTSYGTNDVLGDIGNTGHSFGKHLHFGVIDIEGNKSINPFILLPGKNDNKQPDILEYALRIEDRYFNIRKGSNLRLTQHYPLLVKIQDSIDGRERLGIYKLSYEFNGRKSAIVVFSCIGYTKNILTIQGMPFDDLYDSKGYYKLKNITYNNGENTLKIYAEDFSGNVATDEISFNINLDIK
jgi:hypothetical protein